MLIIIILIIIAIYIRRKTKQQQQERTENIMQGCEFHHIDNSNSINTADNPFIDKTQEGERFNEKILY